MFRWLRRSVEENAIANAECHQIALGSDNYQGILHLAAMSGLHSLLPLPGRVEEGVEIVDVRALDHCIGDAAVDALKIDVKGSKPKCWLVDRTLGKASLASIFLYLHPDLGVDTGEVMSTLAGYGFGLHEPTPPYRCIVPARGVTEVVALRGGRS